MDLVDKAFFRWQMRNQPRRFRQSLAAAGEQLVCALSRQERNGMAAEKKPANDGTKGADDRA